MNQGEPQKASGSQPRPVLVRASLPADEVGQEPFTGRTGLRMAFWAGVTLDELLATFERVTLLGEVAALDGADQLQAKARDKAHAMAMHLMNNWRGRYIVAVGKPAANALGVRQPYRPFHWEAVDNGFLHWASVAFMPDPIWVEYSRAHRSAAGIFLMALMDRARAAE
jgi:hypothetical protein